MTKQQRFIVLETRSTTGKSSWAIHGRGEGYSYTELVARVYSVEWAEKLVTLLNRECDDE